LEMAKDDASTKRRVAGETTRGQRVPYSRDLADTLLERLGAGETMSDICRDPAMPARSSVMRWISEDKDGFGRLYEVAREMQAHELAESILTISDDGRNDWMLKNAAHDAGWVANGENVQRSRLRVDARKWIVSKILPKQYGDVTRNELSGPVGGPIAVRQIEDSTPSIRLLLQQALKAEEKTIEVNVIDGK
jgi:hypothetical protein